MGRHADTLSELRISDLDTFLIVQRCGSLTGAARQLRVTPSQVSKAMARLQEQLGATLFVRGASGVRLSEAGRALLPQLEEVMNRLHQLRHPQSAIGRLTIAAPSYLCTLFVPYIAESVPELRVRGLELPPPMVRALATENRFDVALTLGAAHLPATWVSQWIGDIRKVLLASPALAQALRPFPVPVEKLRQIPWISPIYQVNGQVGQADDDCPLRAGERTCGHEAQTIGLALELAARSQQLVFGPVIAARQHLDEGRLLEIPVQGWQEGEPLFMACNGDRVRASAQKRIVQALQGALLRLNQPRTRAGATTASVRAETPDPR